VLAGALFWDWIRLQVQRNERMNRGLSTDGENGFVVDTIS
jgi:hypothetical protein